MTSGWTACRYGAGDEALHSPGGVPLYNESVYFNFVTGLDDGPRGGVLRVGLRPTAGYAELCALLVERTSGFADAAVAADSDDHLVIWQSVDGESGEQKRVTVPRPR